MRNSVFSLLLLFLFKPSPSLSLKVLESNTPSIIYKNHVLFSYSSDQ